MKILVSRSVSECRRVKYVENTCSSFFVVLCSTVCTLDVNMFSLVLCKVSRPYKQAEFEIMFGEGVSKLVSVRNFQLLSSDLIRTLAKRKFHIGLYY
jgi:RecA/RadA recombinase